MLAIRMQRTGRSGHAQFRLIVQDSRFSPTSGRVVEYLGSYNPHTKEATFDKEKISSYLSHGAQPSERVVILLQKEGVKLPKWAKAPPKKQKSTRNPDKRRSTRPEGAEPPAPAAEASPDTSAPEPDSSADPETAEPARQEGEEASTNAEADQAAAAEPPAEDAAEATPPAPAEAEPAKENQAKASKKEPAEESPANSEEKSPPASEKA